MKSGKKQVLIFTPYYIPGIKAGGPVRSLVNLVETLGDYFEFYIVTADREFRSEGIYQGVEVNKWNQVGKAKVFYCSPDKKNLFYYRRLINRTPYDILYLSSFFEVYFTILPLILNRLRLIDPKQIVIAPHGELQPGALSIKKIKKKLYIQLAKLIGLYSGVRWHATNEFEKNHIREVFKNKSYIRVAENISSSPLLQNITTPTKERGSLRIVFLSRISYSKNLGGVLSILKKIKGEVSLDIYGPIEDKEYWKYCKKLISDMPPNIKISYRGAVPFDKVTHILSKYHLFFFPTKTENYGHVIYEALSAGCPVLISDQTPWKNLEQKNAGFVLPLDKPEKYVEVIENLIECDNETFAELSKSAISYIKEIQESSNSLKGYQSLFECKSDYFEKVS